MLGRAEPGDRLQRRVRSNSEEGGAGAGLARPAGREAGYILIPRPHRTPKLLFTTEWADEATLPAAQSTL